nr:hypothetical protein [Escherichia coli]
MRKSYFSYSDLVWFSCLFLGTSYYYQTKYIPKGTVNIFPDVHRQGEIVDDAFEKKHDCYKRPNACG